YEKLVALARARGEERLRVALICQSNGAHICRYLAKYGGASLEEAEAGRAAPPRELEITRMVLVGTANGRSLRMLREMHRGRPYVPLSLGRRLQPETLFTFPSFYQDLPVYRSDVFLDEKGRTLDVDLFSAAAWETYGWTIYGPASS